MAIEYHVYANDGAGGPIDESTPVATVSGLSWLSPVLSVGSDWSWLVRAFDTVSGLEEKNTTARVRVKLDGAGNDITSVPNAPVGLTARAGAAGTAVVEWAYVPAGQSAPPTGFKVWLTAGGTVNHGVAPAATVAYVDRGPASIFRSTLTGLTHGAEYSVGVRAYNATATEPNEVAVTVTGSATPPNDVQSLSGSAVSRA